MRRLHVLLVASAVTAAAAPAVAFAADAPIASAAPGGCQLGNGIKHVIDLTFDNVHFFRDNPNVPSDLELMPHLRNFIQDNGTMMSNMHTPLIAHTANDSLTTYTGSVRRSSRHAVSATATALQPRRHVRSRGLVRVLDRPIFDHATQRRAP